MLKHLGAFVLAGAFLLPTSACNCGGDPVGSPDTAVPEGEDASESGLDASKVKADTGHGPGVDAGVIIGVDTGGSPGLDASTIQPGRDASTVQPGPDASTAQPGPDASTVQPGPDAARPPGPDAATPPGPDAATPPGPDAATPPGPDAAMPPGPDASIGPGHDAGPGAVVVDIRADVNRNGTVDLTDPTEDLNEDTWDSTHGAIFLANIDDDLNTCPKTSSTSDTNLAKCNDANDTVINGADDPLDFARLKTLPWPGAPGDAKGAIAVTNATYLRLWLAQGASWVVFTPGTSTLDATQIRAGVELGIEGKDIVRNAAIWSGYVDLTYTVTGSGMAATSDKVRLRVAPIMTRHHLHAPLRHYATPISGEPASTAFTSDLKAAITAAGIPNPLFNITADDQWTQDYFETAYMSMPAVGGQHVIDVNIRSANLCRPPCASGKPLREGGRAVFTQLRGKDSAGVQQYDPNHDTDMDTLDSFGNLETIPPYSYNGKSYPLGRVYRGSVSNWHPDQTVLTMMESQAVQPPLYVDTTFLLVGHVDETITFLKANNARGWTIAIADPALARSMLQAQENAGHGNAVMFDGMYWPDQWGSPADVTITDLLDDTAIQSASNAVAAGIADQVAVLKAETGITDAEILHFPILFQNISGYGVAYMVGTANGISMGDAYYGAPEPHGAVVGGADIFKTQLTTELAKLSITPLWLEDWDLYHALDGEVHCGSNTTRQVPATERWWESGR